MANAEHLKILKEGVESAGLNNAKKFTDGAAKKAVKDAFEDLNDEGKARIH